MTGDPGRAEAEAAFGAPAGAPRRPSRAGYWLGAALIALGVLGAVAWFVVGIMRFGDRVDDLQRVDAPGARVMTFSEGRKAIYYEGPGGEDADVPSLEIAIAPVGGGPPLDVGSHGGEVTYSISGHAGRSVAGFDVPRDGRYRVRVGTPDGAPAGAEVAIGRGLGSGIVSAVVGGFAIVLVGGGVGAALIAVTATRRSRTAGA